MAAAKRRRAPATERPANPHRGEKMEAAIELSGKRYGLVLNLNALAEIEAGIGKPMAKLGEVFATPTVNHVRTMIAALVRAGGDAIGDEATATMTDRQVGAHQIDLVEAMLAVQAAFEAAGVFDPKAKAADAPQV